MRREQIRSQVKEEIMHKKEKAMFDALKVIVADRVRQDPYFNIDLRILEKILETHPDKFGGIKRADSLIRAVALDIKDLRRKLNLPESRK